MEAGTDTSYDQDNDSTTETAFSRRVLRRHKTHDQLQVLTEASSVEHGTLWGTYSPNFKKFGEIFDILEFFALKNRLFPYMRRAPCTTHRIGSSKLQMACIFGFVMRNHEFWYLDKKFGQVLGPQKVKKHAKNDLTTPILTHRKQSWENVLLEGQMDTKLENSTWVGK